MQKYRILCKGELLKKGDQFYYPFDRKWYTTFYADGQHCVGCDPNKGVNYRRPQKSKVVRGMRSKPAAR
jgi:hypothetical protein